MGFKVLKRQWTAVLPIKSQEKWQKKNIENRWISKYVTKITLPSLPMLKAIPENISYRLPPVSIEMDEKNALDIQLQWENPAII